MHDSDSSKLLPTQELKDQLKALICEYGWTKVLNALVEESYTLHKFCKSVDSNQAEGWGDLTKQIENATMVVLCQDLDSHLTTKKRLP